MLQKECLLCRHAHTSTHTHTSMRTYLRPCTCLLRPLYRSSLPEIHDSGPHDLKPWYPWIQPSPTMTLFKMSTSSSQASCIFPFGFFFPLCSSFWRLHPSIFAFAMSRSLLLHVVLAWAEDPCSEQTEGPDIGPETQPLLSDTHR